MMAVSRGEAISRAKTGKQGTLAERFWAKVQKGPGCWTWTGCRDDHGYGMFRPYGRKASARRAHRVAWELTHGPIPAGMFACHKCDNPQCVRPAHLFLGTPADNAHDRDKKGRWVDHWGNR